MEKFNENVSAFCELGNILVSYREKTERILNVCTDKKKIKFSSYIRKFRVEQLQSHI
jgi:hypothetical protein